MKKTALSFLSLPLLFADVSSAVSAIDCKQPIPVKGRQYDFSKLDEVHTLNSSDYSEAPFVTNTTWKVNICRPLKYDKTRGKQQCPHGSNICGDQLAYDLDNDPNQEDAESEVFFAISGSFAAETGKTSEPKWTNIDDEEAPDDVLQLELKGGKYQKIDTKAIIKFQCDAEASAKAASERVRQKRKDLDDDDDEDEEDDDEEGGNDSNSAGGVTFVSFEPEKSASRSTYWTLRLNWKTKYVCEDYDDDEDKSKGWGFFTWFILILFLGTAAYLIFGSWLNYNRYGARGWDLVPHADTIRDIPYLVKDWGRKVVDTVTGPGSRGGYAAV